MKDTRPQQERKKTRENNGEMSSDSYLGRERCETNNDNS